MNKWLYCHPRLALLLPYIPALGILLFCCYQGWLTVPLAAFSACLLLLALLLPIRRAFASLLAEASKKLQMECDAPGFLSIMEIMRSRKGLPPERRLLIEANYALGLDAAGHAEQGLLCLRACREESKTIHPALRYQFDMAYACVCAHAEDGIAELPAALQQLEQGYATMPFSPAMKTMIRRNLDTLRDVAQYHSGQYDGLIERFVARIEGYRNEPAMRRSMMLSAMWLARVYEQLGRLREARAMYQFVAENGNTLGVVDQAKDALLRLEA